MQGLEREGGSGQAIEGQNIPILSVNEMSYHRLDDGLWAAHDEPVRESGVGGVQHSHEASSKTVKFALPMNQWEQRNGAHAVLDAEHLGRPTAAGSAPAAAEPLV